jgi:hypothetical protein
MVGGDKDFKSMLEEAAAEIARPRGWLTKEEKAAVRFAVSEGFDEEVLCNLLARSSPPEVVLVEERDWYDGSGRRVGAFDPAKTRAALAAAGVAVKENN